MAGSSFTRTFDLDTSFSAIQSSGHRVFFNWLAERLKIEIQPDWYRVTCRDLLSNGGRGVLDRCGRSAANALRDAFPEYNWHPWLFHRVPSNFWKSRHNQLEYLEWLAQELRIESTEEWYQITVDDVMKKAGSGLLEQYGQNLHKALESLLPAEHWKSWLFPKVENNFWKEEKNQRECLDWIADQLHIDKTDQWHSVTLESLRELCSGRSFVLQDQNLFEVLRSSYPEFEWFPRSFVQVPKHFWKDVQNQRNYLDWLAEQLQLQTSNDLYRLSQEDLVHVDNYGPLRVNGCLSRTLKSVYPEFQWFPRSFEHVPKNFWQNPENQKECLVWVAEQLNIDIQRPEQWTDINTEIAAQVGAKGLISHHGGSIWKALSFVFPEHNWSEVTRRSSGQKHVWKMLQDLLKEDGESDAEVLMNYRHPLLTHSDSFRKMELDIYIPKYQLAFEYQGGQHHVQQGNLFGSLDLQKKRDQEKKDQCRMLGIELVKIPHWWHCSSSSLLSTIRRLRPTHQVK